jgi:hypothetical protein
MNVFKDRGHEYNALGWLYLIRVRSRLVILVILV